MSVKSLATGNRSVSLLAGNTPEHHVLLAESTVGAGGTVTVTFSNIPADYQHLQIRAMIGKASTGNNQIIQVRFNGDTAANYYNHHLYGDGSTAISTNFNNTSPAGTAGAIAFRADNSVNTFCGMVADVLDYANTGKYKTTRSLWGFDTNGTVNGASQYGFVGLTSVLWMSTSAVTSISLIGFNSNVFPQYSTFQLFGVK